MIRHLKEILKRVLPSPVLNFLRTFLEISPAARPTFLKLSLRRKLGQGKSRARKLPAAIRSVLFICHGNIIRSPMAAAWLKLYLKDAKPQQISIGSAGLHARLGREADRRAISVAREFGISLEDHRAEPLSAHLVARADLIVVMDFKNEAELLAIYPAARERVFVVGTFASEEQIANLEIPDPYSGDIKDVRRCYQVLHPCICNLASLLVAPRSQP